MKVTHSLIIDSLATAFSLSPFPLSQSLWLVPCVSGRVARSPAPRRRSRDADEAVEEAIDDHAEPTGCGLGPAVRRRGSPNPSLGIPAPCPARVAPHPDDCHPLSNNRFLRDGSLSLFSLSQSLWLVPCVSGRVARSPAPRRRSVETQTRPSKKRSTIMPSRPAAALAPRSAAVEALAQAPEFLRHVLHESPRVQMKVTHSLIIDSLATALSLLFLSHSLCG